MKKLMIAAAIVCAAVVSQAASVGWSAANYCYMATQDNTPITTQAGYDTLMNGGNIVLVLLGDGTYDGTITSLHGVEGVTGGDTATFRTSGGTAVKYGLNATFSFDYASGILKNGDVLGVMFEDADGNLSQLLVNGTAIDPTYTISGLSNDEWQGSAWKFTTAGTSGSPNYITTVAVPEPTSGLLLLLGIGAMALRRRRA